MAATYTVGDGKDYATIQLAIDAIPGNLSGQGRQWVKVYAKAGGYAETLDLYNGFSNASAADYIDVEAMVSHNGNLTDGIAIDISGAVQNAIYIRSDFARFHGFRITGTASYAGQSSCIVLSGKGCYFYNNIIHNYTQSGNQNIIAIQIDAGNGDVCPRYIFNNIVYQISSNPSSTKQYAFAGNNDFVAVVKDVIANNTIYTNSNGVGGGLYNLKYFNNIDIINNYIGGCTSGRCFTFWGGGGISTFENNISSDSTADDFGGTGNLINKSAADCFESVTAGAENFDLRYTGACYRKGTNNAVVTTTDPRGSLFKLWETGALVKRDQKTVGTSDQVSINGVKYV
jgi:hypothetical protein